LKYQNTFMLVAKLGWSYRCMPIWLVFLAAAQSLCLPANAQVLLQGKDTTSNAAMSFRVLKRLEGTWNGQVTTDPANTDINGPIKVTMHVASSGNVILHEIAPGGMLEPTLIYLDSNRLTMIHYCKAGNRPRLVASTSPDQKRIEFDFVDVSGSHEPVYLSNFMFNLIDADNHTEAWTFTLADGSHLHAHFGLMRTKDGASPN
jgi:hypothetical protein